MPKHSLLGWLFTTALVALSLLCTDSARSAAVDEYPTPPEGQPQADAPKGSVQKFAFSNSRIFPGTQRDYWVYVPSQYNPDHPACVYVNQDGIQHNAPQVFDNLIARKEMPITIGIFVTPGVVPAQTTNSLPRFNRSYEYDTVSGDYVRFLLEELLPDVETQTAPGGRAIRLSPTGNDRCIGGLSSGAICAFTAAWERPDAFNRVFSGVGTYVGLRGGQNYSTLVRKFEPKPIRVFLQDGSNDLNIYAGDWWMANQGMERALRFSGYEVEHVWGEGYHNGKHGAAVFPDAMRYLWKDWPTPVKSGISSNSFLQEILIPGESWQLASEKYEMAAGTAANRNGELFFNDIKRSKTYGLRLDDRVTEFSSDSDGRHGQAFGPDGRLYSTSVAARKVVAFDSGGRFTTIADEIDGHDLVVRRDGSIYVTEPNPNSGAGSRVWLITQPGKKRVVDTASFVASGITFSPDQSLLYVSDYNSKWVYSYQVASDGSLKQKQRYFHLHEAETADSAGAEGLACDQDGRLYVATLLGIQVCDQAGRVECIIPTPNGRVSSIAFAGQEFDTFYAACGDKIFKRKLKVRGVLPFEEPTKPTAPRL
jgi:gluconolactonase